MTNNNTNLLGTAISIAASVHEKQKDQGGNAYILHPMRVMQRLRTTDEELMQMAIMHDVVEDSDGLWTIEKLDALTLLTHAPNEDYETYVRKIATNKDAILIKMEDLRDNSDVTQLKGLREKDFTQMQKYSKAYMFLKNTLDNMKSVGYSK